MKKYLVTSLLITGCIILASFRKQSQIDTEVPYPEGYRKWDHVKSMVISSKEPKSEHSRGYHHIYANEQAMTGYKTGKFPNGAIIVADFIEMIEKDGTIVEGKRKFIDVMVKDTVIYRSTGGWGYEEFEGDSKSIRLITQAKAGTNCFNCHAPKKDNDYVFSTYRE